jgi:hypothetical protein
MKFAIANFLKSEKKGKSAYIRQSLWNESDELIEKEIDVLTKKVGNSPY